MPSNIQVQAIKHLSGPAMIIAGPGSGKTFTIIERILYLIEHHHIPPNQILVITFTKAAALEMKERYDTRVSELLSIDGYVNFGTFHSICYHILQKSGSFQPNSLIKESDKRKIISIILANHGHAERCNTEVLEALLSEISKRKNINNIDQSSQVFGFTQNEIEVFQNEYQEQLHELKQLDFDDMIGKCLDLLTQNPEILYKYQKQFSYILVDEFQDINMYQYQVVKLLAGDKGNLFAVGDDDQSIYGFRGTAPGIMRKFLEDYPTGKRIMLTENYRSGENIVKLAEKVIERNKNRYSKQFIPTKKHGKIFYFCLETRREEEEKLTSEVKSLSESELKKSAVILRTNREVILYRELLRKEGIPIRERKENQDDIFHSFMLEDMISYLKFLYEGKRRTDFLKFMNKPEHYFSRQSLLDEIVHKEDMMKYYEKNKEMQKEINTFFHQLSVAETLSPYMAVSFFRKTIGYDRYLKQKAGNYQEYIRFVSQLEKIQELLKKHRGKLHPDQFFKEQEEQAKKEGGKTVMTQGISVLTMHGAKGLEFEHVFLPDINEGIIPGKNSMTQEALEEERRLLYVAITRAQNYLHIYLTKERNRKPSSFLHGIILPQ